MNIAIWVGISIAIVTAAAPITGGHRTKINEKQLVKLASRFGLPLPSPLRNAVLSRVNPRERTALAWGWGGIVVGALIAMAVQFITGSDSLDGIFVVLGAVLGMSLGSYRGVLRTPHVLSPDAPRVARSQATTLADYVTQAELWAMRLVPVTTGLTVGTLWVIWALVPVKPAGGMLSPILGSVAAAAVLVVWGLLARARTTLVERPQRANNDLELAWDDALRSAAVRDAQDTGISLGMLATLGLLILAGSWVVPRAVRTGAEQLTLNLGLGAFVVGVVCWILLLTPWIIGRSRRNPSLSLWPQPFQAA